MPTPRQWKDRDHLVRGLKNYKWKKWFDREELRMIIRDAVGANTFRAFKRHGSNRPSVTFREWANKALNAKTLHKLWAVKSQPEYDEWLSKLVNSFTRRWKFKMDKKMPFGPSFKLPNLLAKRLCLHRAVKPKDFNRVVWFLHVPLDSYTILAVKNCTQCFLDVDDIGRISKTATMSFVKNRKMYDAFQSGIRQLAREAGVPPITLDCLAWDKSH
jgi:hypothetical protein